MFSFHIRQLSFLLKFEKFVTFWNRFPSMLSNEYLHFYKQIELNSCELVKNDQQQYQAISRTNICELLQMFTNVKNYY